MALVMRILVLIFAVMMLASCQDEAVTSSGQRHTGAMVLAMSWQPAFCEARARLPECRSQRAGRFDADHFTLHGLWPQPRSNVYCGVSRAQQDADKRRRWKQLPGLGLSEEMRKRLYEKMPGTRSFLHRHEWVKHGTCYGDDAEGYYRDSLALMAAINGSSVRDLFARSIGRSVTVRQVRAAFDDAFGVGTGDRLRMSCKRDGRRELIVELTLGIEGVIGDAPDIGALAASAPRTKAGCPRGIVDAVGLQ
ncbi:ribonuclease T2 [Ahrensia sp. R2A130]|nr:ribonuclease T2 [Ahrensia sp. R2A130]